MSTASESVPATRLEPMLSNLETTLTAQFQNLPLELRNKIYLEVFDPILEVTIPLGAHDFFGLSGTDSWRGNPHKRLPTCLNLNHQIRIEAIEEMQHSAMQIIKKITLANPDDLLKALPSNTDLYGLRELIIAPPGRGWEFKKAYPSNSIRNALLRCPQLEELIIAIPVAIFSDDYKAYFGHIFEHGNLSKLTVYCHDAPLHPQANNQWWCDDYTLPRPFEQWFLEECGKRGRGIALSIDLSPGQSSNGGEHHKKSEGNVTFMFHMDWFG